MAGAGFSWRGPTCSTTPIILAVIQLVIMKYAAINEVFSNLRGTVKCLVVTSNNEVRSNSGGGRFQLAWTHLLYDADEPFTVSKPESNTQHDLISNVQAFV